MKNLKIFISILTGLLVAACANDAKLTISANPAAPVLSDPGQKTKSYNKDSVAYILNLDSSGIAETFIGTAAKYGVNTVVNYSLQIDKAGNNFANAQTVTSATTDTLDVSIQQLYTIITNPTGLNSPVGVKSSFDVRIMSTIGASLKTLYSNTKTIKINPLNTLKDYTLVPNIRPYYIIGLGDGKWTNSKGGLGVSFYPLSVVTGKVYNASGDGVFSFTGYFSASRPFKLIRDIGSWDEVWGMTAGAFVHRGGDNITVAADGYYTIKLNSITNTLTITATTAPAATIYTSMGMIGEFVGSAWGTDIAMPAAETTNNHIWYTTYTFATDFTPPVGGGGLKFRANGNWDHNWGAGTFPVGFGTNNGTNIPYLHGKYAIILNDLDGCFYFIPN